MSQPDLKILANYLKKRSLYSSLIKTNPGKELKIVIVIPCFNEPSIKNTLNSIINCNQPKNKVEVIIVINSSENTDIEIINQNKKTKKEIINWALSIKKEWVRFHAILLENLPKKVAGAGYARKVGMDEAISRFIKVKNNYGIICSLDADSTIKKNYLVEIEKLFNKKKETNGCSIYFEHPIEGDEFSDEIYKRAMQYELHVRYYKLMLKNINFPFYHYTIGSCFAVSANAYCLQGGMNKRQAGEDFYFLQKIMPMGNYFELNSTTVYPSSRPSDRVPFGTGPIIKQHLNDPNKKFLTYNYEAFAPLKTLFADISLFFNKNESYIRGIINKYPEPLNEFLNNNGFCEAVKLINDNTSALESFTKRFYRWFDGFKIIKYLNFVHINYFEKIPIEKAITNYLKDDKSSDYKEFNNKDILLFLRKREKKV